MKRVQLIDLSLEQLGGIFEEKLTLGINNLKKELLTKGANEDLLTREQAADFLQINLSTLWHWQQKGKVKAYGISGSRRYYKRSELLEAMQPIKK